MEQMFGLIKSAVCVKSKSQLQSGKFMKWSEEVKQSEIWIKGGWKASCWVFFLYVCMKVGACDYVFCTTFL